jgi:four helix bundle protein
MIAKHFRELVVWQLGDQLRQEVIRLTSTGSAARDFELRDQLRDAVTGVPSNIAEGFRRSTSVDNARFVIYAFTSLDETSDHLDDGFERGYWTAKQLEAARRLVRRLTKGLSGYVAYLLSPEALERSRRIYRAKGLRRRDSARRSQQPNEPNEPNERNDP